MHVSRKRIQAPAFIVLLGACLPMLAFSADSAVNGWLRKQNDAFSSWDIGGSFRVRAESSDNIDRASAARDFQRSIDDSTSFLWFHEKVHVGYNPGAVKVFVEAQNGHTSSDENPKRPGEMSLDVYQAYVSFESKKNLPFLVSAGRQELKVGDQRLIGVPSWGHTGRAFDSIRAKVSPENLAIDAFVAKPVKYVDGHFDRNDSHDLVTGLSFTSKKWIPRHETQAYVIGRNTSAGTSTSPRDIYSFVLSVKSLPKAAGPWSWEALVMSQVGDVTVSGVELDQRAWGLHLQASYVWNDAAGKPSAGVEYNYSSGDSDPTDGRSETVDILFGSNHGKYGIMDLTGWRNVHELHGFAGAKLTKKISATANVHGFWLADTHDYFYPQGGGGRSGSGFGRNAAYDSFLGTELSCEVVWKAREWLDTRLGVSRFLTGSYVDQSKASVGGSADASWYYLQGTVSF